MNTQKGNPAGWQFWIDRGGTFTDIIATRPDGSMESLKLLSEHPEEYEDAVLEGIRRMLPADGGPLDSGQIDALRVGSTVATNALLEGTGAPTLLVITRGFGDALRIGYQDRPEIFAREIVLPPVPYAGVLEVDERVAADGEIVRPIDESRLRGGLEQAFAAGLRAVAVVFMHGYEYPEHERRAAEIAHSVGFEHVSVSHDVSPVIKLVSRGHTTVVDSHLTPVLHAYIDSLEHGLGDTPLLFMQSNGGLSHAKSFRGKDAVLSGPAGGVIGMVGAGKQSGFERMIGFDMGGTSTDVSLYDGHLERADTFVIAGLKMRTSALAIHTVAAGGGSVLRFDGHRLRVGDQSAGAVPGPVCYGRGGPLAVTDCHVQLGRLRPEFFPHVLGSSGDKALDQETVAEKFAQMAAEIRLETGVSKTPEALADDFLRIAVDKMAQAVRRISIERGHDPEEFVLVPFGGAAGQHACRVADQLGIAKILVDPFAGVLSAKGIGEASVSHVARRSLELVLSVQSLAQATDLFMEMEQSLRHHFDESRARSSQLSISRRLYLRYAGTETSMPVVLSDQSSMVAALADRFQMRFGFNPPDEEVFIESLELRATLDSGAGSLSAYRPPESGGEPGPVLNADVWIDGSWRKTPFFRRSTLQIGRSIPGPAAIVEENATTIVEPGWKATVESRGELILERLHVRQRSNDGGARYDPTRLTIFNHLFRDVAEQMGIQLRQTAQSVNIKERLDFSCALFDPSGDLVANAPHIPVHIGSMSETVRQVMESRKGGMKRGDAYLTNDPYRGGTHLPDLTVISPFFDEDSTEPLFYVASRAHHAEIGGISPGSMPASSTHIDQEGILFDDFALMESGRLNETELRRRLTAGAWPSRDPQTNINDIKAQIAANKTGLTRLRAMIDHYDVATVRSYMRYVKDNASEAVRAALRDTDGGHFALSMDSGQQIVVDVQVDQVAGTAVVDFEGTSGQSHDNENAPSAVTTAAVLYVMRLLVDDDIPLNAGCLDPIEIRIPDGSMLKPTYPAAVVGGNVETSQFIVDALLGSLGIMAGSQGTMNNLTFGDTTHQYYETICGGSGAGRGFNGTSAVQSHMTNSRLTDPEILESRHPVLVEEFSIRRGSGGNGEWAGGDGVVRKLRFKAGMSVSILSNRRNMAPHGLYGGQPGQVGQNRIERADGSVEVLAGHATAEIKKGDLLIIETPGGGGFGRA